MVDTVLTKHSEMVSTEQAFSARATYGQILPKLRGLIDIPITITKICGLIPAQMDAKAFGRAASNSCQ
jgi:hypothetical protein